ncbi:N-acyl-D-amino-acid deacylase [Halorubrum aquaticum]|uniref:N-acyl-D-amino-acid deacylase n=1 Tax=Halorubrum aquaticum TaxID=387340 RepID=A0A1I2ZVP5_9EURY|nr:D-aminoacylase [Halorubrum aquaticum]SFH41893.1 N-acyl-D-amino-acid deacylase [Halorubrum aquaticum]
MTEDVEFSGATVYDGSGAPAIEANVRLVDGRIDEVSADPIGAERVIDVDGAALAPGFVDMHAHSELRLLDRPETVEKVTQGVTLEVLGQDGVSVAPVPEGRREEWARRVQTLLGTHESWGWQTTDGFLDALERAEPAVNCAYYAPHGNLRSLAAGFEDRPLEPAELERVSDALDTAIGDGAFALSTGMIYPPSSYGTDEELEALGERLATRDSFMVSHVWNESDAVVESIDRFVQLCESAGCQPHVSHLKVAGEDNWGASEEILEVFDAANERGVRVTFDQYPWTAGSTMLTALLPPWARTGETDEILERLTDPDARDRIRHDIESGDGDWENLAKAAGSWENVLITDTGSGRAEGETVAGIGAEHDADPVDAICDLLVEEDLDVTMADFVMDDEDIDRFLSDLRGTICTDGIFGGKPHPRAVGTYPRLLERYVRDREVLPLEDAVYKAAGHPADVLGLPDRGRVFEGYVADLVVFDPDRVRANATFNDPMRLSDGIEHVVVGGEFVVEDGEPTGTRPGRVLRSVEEWEDPRRPDLSDR